MLRYTPRMVERVIAALALTICTTLDPVAADQVETSHGTVEGTAEASGVRAWPPVAPGADAQVMRIDVESRAEREAHRARHLFLDSVYTSTPR